MVYSSLARWRHDSACIKSIVSGHQGPPQADLVDDIRVQVEQYDVIGI